MKIFFKLIVVIVVSVLFAFMFRYAGQTYYHPVIFTIELKSDQDEQCQLFYSSDGNFSEAHSLGKSCQSDTAFEELTFRLPESNIRKLRFDPGSNSEIYEIRQITIQVGEQSETYSGHEIPDYFDFTNLEKINSLENDRLLLCQVNNPDVQLLFKQGLDTNFITISHTKMSYRQILVILLYLLIVALVVYKGRLIFDYIRKTIKSPHDYFLQTIVFTTSKFSIAVLLLFSLKLVLASAQQMSAYTDFVHDDALFIRLAYSIGSGKWLGYYNNLTLAKGFVYPMFIALTNFAGIPLFLAQNLILGFASFLMVKSLSPVLSKNTWKIVLFAILIFNPATTDVFTTRILRDAFFVNISIVVVAAFTGIYLRRNCELSTLLKWSVLAGIALFLQQNTREEGFVFIPVLVLFSVFSIFGGIRAIRSTSLGQNLISTISKSWPIVRMTILPYFILIVGNLLLASVNYAVYGGFVRNEIKSEAFTSAFSSLSKIESEKWIINVPVTYEARKKAYEVSPAFAELEEYMEGGGNGFLAYGNDPHEILGAHFMWALRYAAEAAGYHQSLPKSQEFYRRVAREIDEAFDTGKLKKKENFSLFSYSWDSRFADPTLTKLWEITGFVMSFEGYSPAPWVSSGNPTDITWFQNMTNERACIVEFTKVNQPLSAKARFFSLIGISNAYGFLNPPISLIAVFSFILLTVFIIFRKRSDRVMDIWLLSCIFLALAISRIVLIAFISVSQWDAMNMQYLSVTYPFLLLFEFLTIFTLFDLLKKKNLLVFSFGNRGIGI